MDNRNLFSDEFEKKTSDELTKIVNDKDYQKKARLAAVWELERRNEATDEQQYIANKIIIEEEEKKASQLTGKRYRTFWQRFLAAIIDGFVLWPVVFLIDQFTVSNIVLVSLIGNMLHNFLPYIYSVFMHGYSGQTLGKMTMRIKVVDVKYEDEIDLRQAFIRDSVPITLMLALYAYFFILTSGENRFEEFALTDLAPIIFIGFLSATWTVLEIISMLFSEKSRAIHDLIARTVVVRTD